MRLAGHLYMTRTDLLSKLVTIYGYKSYLEIGIASGSNFREVLIASKTGVDPDPAAQGTRCMTSDQFFAQNRRHFDLIFIDGLHERPQVDRDLQNSLKVLRGGGSIVLHDCNPISEEMQTVPQPLPKAAWTGDVWKSIALLRMHRPELSVWVVDTDWGCGIVQHGKQSQFPSCPHLSNLPSTILFGIETPYRISSAFPSGNP
jgi:SAM-dependent methyltransferase